MPIGSSLSPKLASFFMLHFENRIKKLSWFPRVYLRYVDDIFAVVKKDDVEKIRLNLSSQFESIKFTSEKEQNNQLPFLDLMVKRIGENLKFSIYRKPTSTQLFIGSDSNHSRQHKMAAFNSMMHRLFTVPLDNVDFEVEKKYIYETARMNGYSSGCIDKIFKKHKKRKETRELTNLDFIEANDLKFLSMPFFPNLTHKLSNELRKFGYKVVYENSGSLKDCLGSAKDKIKNDEEKSGIYQVKCTGCNKKYIGKTKRKLKTRYKEHIEDTKKTANDKKPLAKHAIEENHLLGPIELLKEVKKPSKLDAYESLFLSKEMSQDLLNIQIQGNNPSILFKFV